MERGGVGVASWCRASAHGGEGIHTSSEGRKEGMGPSSLDESSMDSTLASSEKRARFRGVGGDTSLRFRLVDRGSLILDSSLSEELSKLMATGWLAIRPHLPT